MVAIDRFDRHLLPQAMNQSNPSVSNEPAPLRHQQWLLSGQITQDDPIREYEIHDRRFTIGRSSQSSLCLPIGNVSKNHAEIRWDGRQLKLRDLGSTNGTFVNGERVRGKVSIKNGDLLQFASVVFRVGRQGAITDHQTVYDDNCDQALAMIQFDRLIDSGAFVPYYQPIVSLKNRQTVGYEVLGAAACSGCSRPWKCSPRHPS